MLLQIKKLFDLSKKGGKCKICRYFLLLVNFLRTPNDGRVVALITPLIIAGALEEFGVSVRISAMRIGSDSNITTSISPVKDYFESVSDSFNRAFNLLGQDDVAGTFYAFFKHIFKQIQSKLKTRRGRCFYEVKYYKQNYMNEMMQRYKNWASENSGASFINTKVTIPTFNLL